MALLIIAVVALGVMGSDAESITTAIVSGLCGIAVGKSLNGNDPTAPAQ